MKKYIKADRGLILLIVLFVMIFVFKAFLYNLVNDETVAFIEKSLSFIPENVQFYVLLIIYFVFMFPITWFLGSFRVFNSGSNQFIAFSCDIFLTIFYLAFLYFVIRKLFYFFKKGKGL
ncbi:hypothetical protein GYA28_02290 [Candidatus Roizmanbacteria bacterium]|jgi:hypothetical protein|nr:hypothetical protein [Candidatus Roizmanbacteria bacterium]